MQTILKRYNFLAYILIAQLITLPSPAFAQSIVGTHATNTPLKVVVLEVSDGTLKPQEVEKVTDTVRDELQSQQKFDVVPKTQTRQFFVNNPTVMQRIDVANPLNRYLDDAKEFYKTFQFKEAIGLLSNVIDSYCRATPAMPQNFLLVDAYLYLGNVYMGNKQEKDANNVFMEAVRLDPQREITEEKYPPKVVRKFGESKTEALSKAKTAQLDVFTNPRGAEIYINGVPQGQAPIKLDRFTQGEHFILAKQTGFKPQAARINIDSNYSRIKLDLEKDQQPVQTSPGLMVKNLQDVEDQVQMASKVGNLMGADKVVLVSLQEIGYNNKITGRMIDMKYYASHKPKSVEVLDLPKDTRGAAHAIAEYMTTQADVDLGKDPKKFADSEVLVLGTKKKKSFWKSPLPWTLMGIAVAGGATAGIMLGTRGPGGPNPNATTVSVTGSANSPP